VPILGHAQLALEPPQRKEEDTQDRGRRGQDDGITNTKMGHEQKRDFGVGVIVCLTWVAPARLKSIGESNHAFGSAPIKHGDLQDSCCAAKRTVTDKHVREQAYQSSSGPC